MIADVPDAPSAVAKPVAAFTLTTAGALDDQVPPVATLNNVPVLEGHNVVAPVIVPGIALTVTSLVADAPQPVEYTM